MSDLPAPSSAPPPPAPSRPRIESLDAFRGFTIFAMIFVIMVAGYRNLPHTFPHFGSAPISTWKHAGYDGNLSDWAQYEGATTPTLYLKGRITAAGDTGFTATFDDPLTTEPLEAAAARIPYVKPLGEGDTVYAYRSAPAAPIARIFGPGTGCTFTDLVAPFFVFIVGVAIPLSRASRGPGWWRHALLRTLYLIAAGVIYISLILKISYWWGILQAIGVAYLMGAIAVQVPVLWRVIAIFAIAAIHQVFSWYLPWWTTVGDPNLPFFTIETWRLGKEADYLRPLTVHCTPWASIGYGLCTIAGTIIGEAVASRDHRRVIRDSLIYGTLFTAAGYIVHRAGFPMHKDFVSSSYCLFTAGVGILSYLAFYAVIDIARIRGWNYIFSVFGANALLAYFLQPIVRIFFTNLGLYDYFRGNAGWNGMLWGLIWTMALWVVCLWCNRRNIYWKL